MNGHLEWKNTVLNLVHNVLAQHDLVSFRHRLARQRGFRSTEQRVVAQAIVDSLYEIDQENLLVILEVRCPKTGNSISEQLKPVRKKKGKKNHQSIARTRRTPHAKCQNASASDSPPRKTEVSRTDLV
jgi:hypothetical protein